MIFFYESKHIMDKKWKNILKFKFAFRKVFNRLKNTEYFLSFIDFTKYTRLWMYFISYDILTNRLFPNKPKYIHMHIYVFVFLKKIYVFVFLKKSVRFVIFMFHLK